MEKNALLAIVLTVLFFIVYSEVIKPRPPQKITQAQGSQKKLDPKASDLKSNPTKTQGLKTSELGEDLLPSSPVEKPVERSPEELTTLEDPLYEAVFSSHSGILKSWKLKNYQVSSEELLLEEAKNTQPDSQSDTQPDTQIDLFRNTQSQQPFALTLSKKSKVLDLDYQVTKDENGFILHEAQTSQLKIIRSVMKADAKYSLNVHFKLTNTTEENIILVPGLKLAAFNNPKLKAKGFFIFKMPPDHTLPTYLKNDDLTSFSQLKEVQSQVSDQGRILWTGLADRYFLRAIISGKNAADNSVDIGRQGNHVFTNLRYAEEKLAPGETKDFQFIVYMGPKDLDLLSKYELMGLDQAVDMGFFGFIGKPLLWLLKLLHSVLQSWGLAIIALTILVKLLLHPISKKSMQSMKAMQKLQPKMKELKEKYKDDKQRLNMEMMNLFKSNSVNPVGGCLPLLLQMPIYIALYQVFFNSIDLYQAPFLLYADLSAPDPYYISPILLGVFMFLQQKLTPTASMEPAQQKMMMFMPILFSVFLIYLPAGLVIYIFVNTVMSVVQQYMNNNDLTFVQILQGKWKSAA